VSYKLKFHKKALKEWAKLDGSVKDQFRSALIKRLEAPHVESARLSGMDGAYKIKLKAVGYRLVYTVSDDVLIVTVVAVGKRERNQAYKLAVKRI